MAKKRISSVDLCWLISEKFDPGKPHGRTSLAVVPDEKYGWRVIVANRSRRFLTVGDERRLADIQRKLRLMYQIRSCGLRRRLCSSPNLSDRHRHRDDHVNVEQLG
jgi:hypothetical protein